LNAKNFESTEKDNEILQGQEDKVTLQEEIEAFNDKLMKLKDE